VARGDSAADRQQISFESNFRFSEILVAPKVLGRVQAGLQLFDHPVACFHGKLEKTLKS
jgi:hypothetical protein